MLEGEDLFRVQYANLTGRKLGESSAKAEERREIARLSRMAREQDDHERSMREYARSEWRKYR